MVANCCDGKKGWTSSHELLKALKMLIVIVIIGFVADAESVTKPKDQKGCEMQECWDCARNTFCEVQRVLQFYFIAKLW